MNDEIKSNIVNRSKISKNNNPNVRLEYWFSHLLKLPPFFCCFSYFELSYLFPSLFRNIQSSVKNVLDKVFKEKQNRNRKLELEIRGYTQVIEKLRPTKDSTSVMIESKDSEIKEEVFNDLLLDNLELIEMKQFLEYLTDLVYSPNQDPTDTDNFEHSYKRLYKLPAPSRFSLLTIVGGYSALRSCKYYPFYQSVQYFLNLDTLIKFISLYGIMDPSIPNCGFPGLHDKYDTGIYDKSTASAAFENVVFQRMIFDVKEINLNKENRIKNKEYSKREFKHRMNKAKVLFLCNPLCILDDRFGSLGNAYNVLSNLFHLFLFGYSIDVENYKEQIANRNHQVSLNVLQYNAIYNLLQFIIIYCGIYGKKWIVADHITLYDVIYSCYLYFPPPPSILLNKSVLSARVLRFTKECQNNILSLLFQYYPFSPADITGSYIYFYSRVSHPVQYQSRTMVSISVATTSTSEFLLFHAPKPDLQPFPINSQLQRQSMIQNWWAEIIKSDRSDLLWTYYRHQEFLNRIDDMMDTPMVKLLIQCYCYSPKSRRVFYHALKMNSCKLLHIVIKNNGIFELIKNRERKLLEACWKLAPIQCLSSRNTECDCHCNGLQFVKRHIKHKLLFRIQEFLEIQFNMNKECIQNINIR